MKLRNIRYGAIAGLALTLRITALPAHAAESNTQTVTEADVVRQVEDSPPTNNWVLYTRAGTPATAGQFVEGPATPPAGSGSLQLTTTTSSEKVYLFNYDHVDTRLADVDDISYSTYRSAGTADQLAALNLQVDVNGPTVDGGFTTLVFEPVYNLDQHAVQNETWQTWDADGSGLWWSTRAINGQGAGATTVNMRTWDQIVAANPDAVIVSGVGINQGSGNAGLTDSVDNFRFDTTTYNFESDADGDGVPDTAPPTDKDQCKNGGWQSFNSPSFSNQGQCVSFVAAGK